MHSIIALFIKITVLTVISIFVCGCNLSPDYTRPVSPIPNTYNIETEGNGEISSISLPWKTFFKDHALQRLITLALINNRDLRISLLNIEKTRAQYQIQQADLLPTINASAEVNTQRFPPDYSGTGSSTTSHQYAANLGFSTFELDLFGRIRNLTEQALEIYYSVEEDAKIAQITLIAEIVGLYLQLVADREILDITTATYQNRKNQYELIRNKFETGIASALELSQSRSIMEESRSNIASYQTRVGQDENYLSLLLGTVLPSDLPDVRKLSDIEVLADIPPELPSMLLESRPDIVAAEHRLKGMNANIGAARANFFPTVLLTGAFGTISTQTSDLFSGSYWQFLPQVRLPIFDYNRNTARLEVSEADHDIAIAQYEKTIQVAFREVVDTLIQRKNIDEQLSAETSLLEATIESFELANARYDVGIDSYLNVLDAQRSLYSAQQSYIATKLLRETNAIMLYKALGGGWQ